MAHYSILQFRFESAGTGAYNVTYTTPERGDYYKAMIEDMTLTDATYRSDEPTQQALRELANAVRIRGTHYSKRGEEIYQDDYEAWRRRQKR